MNTQTIRFDRLRLLAAFLSTLPPEQIEMDQVISNREAIDFKKVKAGEVRECGAIGCAIGWAGLLPEFRSEGLKFTRKGSIKLNGEFTTFDVAGAEFFGLTRQQSAWLFGPLRAGETSSKAAFNLRIRALFALSEQYL